MNNLFVENLQSLFERQDKDIFVDGPKGGKLNIRKDNSPLKFHSFNISLSCPKEIQKTCDKKITRKGEKSTDGQTKRCT